jgi:DNA processing protein
MGRDVFSVPGKIDSPKSKGTNHLIKQGAKLVETADDIVSELSVEVQQALQPKRGSQKELTLNLPEDEQRVFDSIRDEEIHIDSISTRVGLPTHLVSGILVRLEIKGLIRQLAGKVFVRS